MRPRFFILYINDLCSVSKVLKCVLFADDTNILCTEGDIQQLMTVLTTEMTKVKAWSDRNKLSLNLNEAKHMMFGNHKINIDTQLTVNNYTIKRVKENKFLCVTLDYNLC